MTVASTVNRNDYLAGGPTFSLDFKLLADTDLVVLLRNQTTGVATALTLNTDFTVAGVGVEGGGSSTLLTGLPAGYKVTFLRHLELTQPTDVRNQGDYLASLHEDEFDRLLMQIQQGFEEDSRALKIPATEVGSDDLTVLPPLEQRENMVLGFDGNGRPTAVNNVPTSPLITLSAFFTSWLVTTPVAFMQTLLTATTTSAARLALGISAFWSGRLILTPPAFMQTFISASTAAAARAALGFTAGLEFILGGDIADGTITADKLAFGFSGISGITRNLRVYNTSVHQISALADTLKIEEVNASAVTQAADMEVNGTGGLEFTTPGGTTPSTEQASKWYSIWVICKADGTAQTTILSASLTSPNMPSGYVGSAGRKVRVGVVYNNAAKDFEDFRIDGDWFEHLRTTAHRTFNGGASWDGGTAIGSLFNAWVAFTTNPASVPDIETEIHVQSQFTIGSTGTPQSSGVVCFGRVIGGAAVALSAYIWGGISTNLNGPWGIYAPFGGGSTKIYQDASRKVACKLSVTDWSYPAFYMWVTGFRIPTI